MTQTVRVSWDGDLARVVIDNPPVNATSTDVRAGLMEAVAAVGGARGVLLSCAGRTFVAGGDLREFDAPAVPPHLPDVVDAIEACAAPWIALCHGTVLGGGFEIAMACAWRVARPGTRFGLPEVSVGVIPGAGGTQRLPRLVPFDVAVEMATTGAMVDAARMADLGVVDLVTEDLEAGAAALLERPRPVPVSRRSAEVPPEVDAATVQAAAKGAEAPVHALRALAWAAEPYAVGQPKERALHLELRGSRQARALRHVFFAERAAAAAGKGGTAPERIAIVGGGLMGAGIATAALIAGCTVTVIERDAEAAGAARERIAGLIAGAARRGKVDAAAGDRLSVIDEIGGAAGAQLAVEAVFEDLAAKRQVFARLAAVVAPDAVLATNTSYLDPREIFADVPGPERCLGLHFFSPAHVMKLVEVVPLPQTAPEVVASAAALAARMGKVPVTVGICEGFVGNRMLAAYRGAADRMLEAGADVAAIDAAARSLGYAMGPYRVQDMAGLQIAWARRQRLGIAGGIADRLCEAGRLGAAAGAGWYDYDGRTARPSDTVARIVADWRREAGIAPREFAEAEIARTLAAVLANEGFLCVEEGIAGSEADVDLVQIHGYGLARWTGGTLWSARADALPPLRDAMERLAADAEGWPLSRTLSDA